jgi:hypothetical protein
MAQHKLSLEVPETATNWVMRIMDTSVYSDTIEIDCPILEITAPGFRTSVQIGTDSGLEPNFNVNLTACNLELQTADCGTVFSKLPDGVYVIKYSVSPNDSVFVEYNHLRMTKAILAYQEVLCDLDVAACEPNAETEKKLKDLRKIKMYLDAAKAKVEICHNPTKGMELYSYAVKLLGKFGCKSC